MGARIFAGFRLATDSFTEALAIVNAFRPWVTAEAEKLLDTYMDNIMQEKGVKSREAYDMWQEKRRKLTALQVANPADTEFSILLIPYAGGVLGRVYTVQRAWTEKWLQQPGVEEFSYWDNEARPKDVTKAEWQARAEALAVITDQPMSMQGFAIELVSPEGPLPKQWRNV